MKLPNTINLAFDDELPTGDDYLSSKFKLLRTIPEEHRGIILPLLDIYVDKLQSSCNSINIILRLIAKFILVPNETYLITNTLPDKVVKGLTEIVNGDVSKLKVVLDPMNLLSDTARVTGYIPKLTKWSSVTINNINYLILTNATIPFELSDIEYLSSNLLLMLVVE